MHRRRLPWLLAAALAAAGFNVNAACDVGEAVAGWARDWSERGARPRREAIAFEFDVAEGGRYRVELSPQGEARLAEPRGEAYATRFSADTATYCAIASGRMNVLTTLAQARSSDPTPLQADIPEAYAAGERLRGELIPAWFHFFTAGAPEVVRFGFEHGRQVHGGIAVPLYYGSGLRSAWYGLEPGMHVNREAEDQVNPFDSIFVVIEGTVEARFDGRPRTLRRGESAFVPAGMAHEFRAGAERAEFVVIMVGDGA